MVKRNKKNNYNTVNKFFDGSQLLQNYNYKDYIASLGNNDQQGSFGKFANFMNSDVMNGVYKGTGALSAATSAKNGQIDYINLMAQNQTSSGNPIFDGVGKAVGATANIMTSIDNMLNKPRDVRQIIGYKCGGKLNKFNFGGVNANTISSAATTLGGLAANAVQQAGLTADTNSLNQGVLGYTKNFDNMGMDALMDAESRLRNLGLVTARDLRNKTWFGDFANSIGAGNQGATAGGAIGGGIGAVIGGVLGTGSSLIGSIIGRSKANKEASLLNSNIAYVNDYNNRSLTNAYDNVKLNQLNMGLSNYTGVRTKQAAFGGNLMQGGATYPTGLVHIDEGGTHESNPYEGIQVGIDPQGIPNLVEEGETIYNDYVFSNRLTLPNDMKKKYKLGGKKISFSDASKTLTKEYDEMPNDVIAKRGRDAVLNDLMESQEQVRQKEQMREFSKLSPEEQQMVLQQAAQEEQESQMPSPEEQAMMEQQAQEEQMMQEQQEPMGLEQYAFGGRVNKFATNGQMSQAPGELYQRTNNTTLSDYTLALLEGLIDEKGNIDVKKAYEKNSPWERTRQTYIDNWNNDKFKNAKVSWIKQLYEANKNNAEFKKQYKDYNDFESKVIDNLDYFKKVTSDALDNNKNFSYAHNLGSEEYNDFYRNEILGPVNYGLLNREYGISPSGIDNNKIRYNLFANKPDTNFRYTTNGVYDISDNTMLKYADTKIKPIGSSIQTPTLKFPSGNYGPVTEKAQTQDAEQGKVNTGTGDSTTKGRPDMPLFDSWLRYVSPIGKFGMAAYSALTPADYKNAEMLESYANKAGENLVSPELIGDYMRYKPIDRLMGINQLNASAGATRRNILNTSGLNRGAAMAGLLAADYNAGNNIGNLFVKAEDSNWNRYNQALTFNKDTNKYNADNIMKANLANQAQRNHSYDLLKAAVAMREAIDNAKANSVTSSIAAGLGDLGKIGQERIARKQAKWMIDNDVYETARKSSKGGRIKRGKRGLTI